MSTEKNIQEKISWLGWQEQPFSVVDQADLLLLHSKNEGFGLVLVEAMMRGIPCVAADCPVGPASIVQNGINGWLYNMDDERELQKIIQEIIDKKRKLPDPEVVQKSVEKFEKDVVCEKIFLSIKKVIQEKPLQKVEEVKTLEPMKPQIQEQSSQENIQKEVVDLNKIEALENEYLSKLRYLIEKNKMIAFSCTF